LQIMDPVENPRAVARELVSIAQRQGIDLEPFRSDYGFQNDRRSVWFWRKDESPWSGPANEAIGTLQYNMQGAVDVLPNVLKDSASAFRGAWTEAGTFEDIQQAFELLRAWLIDGKEVDQLPFRRVRRYGI
jgi:hypothetical protein